MLQTVYEDGSDVVDALIQILKWTPRLASDLRVQPQTQNREMEN